MTTIAYRRGKLAADSRATVNGWIQHGTSIDKMFRLQDGGVAAITGDTAKGMELVQWLQSGGESQRPSPDLGDDAQVIRMLPDGLLRIYEAAAYYDLDVPFAAWGSGMPPALAALHMGADPIQAVRVAALIDPCTGGDIIEMSVK